MELGNTSWLRQGWRCDELPQDARKESRLKVLHVGIEQCRFFGCVSTAECRATIVCLTSCAQQGWSYELYHGGSTRTARGQKCPSKAPVPDAALASIESRGEFDAFTGRIDWEPYSTVLRAACEMKYSCFQKLHFFELVMLITGVGFHSNLSFIQVCPCAVLSNSAE